MKSIIDYIEVERRYTRSINLERDIERSDSVLGYVLGPKAIDTLSRFYKAYNTPNINRAWTITGVYGTGKSSFAHYLSAMCSSSISTIKENALKILSDSVKKNNTLYRDFTKNLPDRGLVKAVATAHVESINNCIVRALFHGAVHFWNKRKPSFFNSLKSEYNKISSNKNHITTNRIAMKYLKDVATASKNGVLLIIDELGKILEYSVINQAVDELYILQQIAELPASRRDPKILFFGVLHQSFSDYAQGLAVEQKNEWAKIQGRFEDILFTESYEQLIRIMGKAICHNSIPNKLLSELNEYATQWKEHLHENKSFDNIDATMMAQIYPLHPLTAVILPFLCNKYAQNERTLFTFLTGQEPYSFLSFLQDADSSARFTTLKIANLYDYFIEGMGGSMAFRPEFQRWVEIKNRLEESYNLDIAEQSVLKTIGIMNLIFSSGSLRASKEIVISALSDLPNENREYWESIIQRLVTKNSIIWRRQADELRLWEGSDFNIDYHIAEQKSKINESIADLLNEYYPLKNIIAQRHSYVTGTLRYFKQMFFDNKQIMDEYSANYDDADGLIGYYIGTIKAKDVVCFSKRPLIVVSSKKTEILSQACIEYIALRMVKQKNIELQHDGVARREITERLLIAQSFLNKAIEQVFDVHNKGVSCFIEGNKQTVSSRRQLNSLLSEICDNVYPKGPIFINELVNRRAISSQAAKARKILLDLMLNKAGIESLGIQGHGPERSIFESLFIKNCIYSCDKYSNSWYFIRPDSSSGLSQTWRAIEDFCFSAKSESLILVELYKILQNPPYGINKPIIPLLLAAVILANHNRFGLFKNGTFIPVLTADDFEMIEKKPDIFSIKHFEISGIKSKLLVELEKVFVKTKSNSKNTAKKENKSVLNLARPFVQFVNNLPPCTVNTKSLSLKAINVRRTLLEAKEPDLMLFHDLPIACNFNPEEAYNKNEIEFAQKFRKSLEESLVELQRNYSVLIERCKSKLHEAFEIPIEKDLQSIIDKRATHIIDSCFDAKLKRFLQAATNKLISGEKWIKSLVMIISDKPSENWNDDDFHLFEYNLFDIARRFKNIESVHTKLTNLGEKDLTAIQIIITSNKKKELSEILWIDENNKEKVQILADEILANPIVKKNKELKKALLSVLVEKIISEER